MITKKQALTEGLKLWTILAQTGGSEKKDVPGPWQRYMNRCPCCEYAKPGCEQCLVMWLGVTKKFSHCCYDGSPYKEWQRAETVKERKFFAQQVADLHEEALDLL